MGLSDAVPSALALTLGDSGRRLSLDRTQPQGAGPWVRLEALELDVPARLKAALRGCVSPGSGCSALRVWSGAGAPWIGGRLAIGHREAPFTIRVAVDAPSPGERQLGLFLGDVRLYGPLPLPAPLVGTALARAIVDGAGGVAGGRAGHRRGLLHPRVRPGERPRRKRGRAPGDRSGRDRQGRRAQTLSKRRRDTEAEHARRRPARAGAGDTGPGPAGQQRPIRPGVARGPSRQPF